MTTPLYHSFENKTVLARHVARYLQNLTAGTEKVYIAISGGSTPQLIFDVLANEFANAIEWSKLMIYWVDERCVPPTHPDSNYLMTQTHLLGKIEIPQQNVFRIKGELPPHEALDQYVAQIADNVPLVNGTPQFDLVILGMGDDGHTASIFPHEIELWQSANICELGHHPQSNQVRVTLTGTVINHAKRIVFLVTGPGKAPKVAEIFGNSKLSHNYPASLVDWSKTTWLLDADAAALVD